MPHPVITALDNWMSATNTYAECARDLPPQPLALTASALATQITLAAHNYRPRHVTTVAWHHMASQIVQKVQEVSLRFISDEYSDDDTDAPCDVEWDVHSLVALVDPSHVIPEEIEPAHVVGTVFPHPSDDV